MWIPNTKWIHFAALRNTGKSRSHNKSRKAVHAKIKKKLQTTGVTLAYGHILNVQAELDTFSEIISHFIQTNSLWRGFRSKL